jgi:hypothetical protein
MSLSEVEFQVNNERDGLDGSRSIRGFFGFATLACMVAGAVKVVVNRLTGKQRKCMSLLF